jgi:RNA polymerase sigma-70 factor (ECF subfamily)
MEGIGLMSQVPPQPHQAAQTSDAPAADGSAAGVSLESLVLAHHAAVYRYAFRLAGTAADAEDLAQQTFLIAQQKLHQLRETERASGWLFAITRTSYLKSLAKRMPATCDGDLADTPAPCREILEIDSQELQQVLAELPPELRLTLVMFYFEELSYKEIAQELEIPIGTVMSRLSRAKQRLRERLGIEVPAASPPRKQTVDSGLSVASRSTHTAP